MDLNMKISSKLFIGKLNIDENDDYYKLSIDINPFPNRFPIVKEIGGRIPKKEDRHVYPQRLGIFVLLHQLMKIFSVRKAEFRSIAGFIDRPILIPYCKE